MGPFEGTSFLPNFGLSKESLSLGLVTQITFFIYGSKKLYVTKVLHNMVFLGARVASFTDLPQ